MPELYAQTLHALMQRDPATKCLAVERLYLDWADQQLTRDSGESILPIDVPGRPERPELVDPRQVPRRSLANESGRKVMLHAFAHIEFNAINLALDAVYRFRQMPDEFIRDWLQVAGEEARHFQLINDYLVELGSGYGEFSAHNGLWDMACKTRDDVLHRMALVPRVMEARGLDVTPGLMERFRQVGDLRAVDILRVIYDEEIGHVTIGNRWYHYCCQLRGVEPISTFRELVKTYFDAPLRGPFNHDARVTAGFTEDELTQLENSL
jgi:uncharacterized ferritin-like protein (DUF455 family)